MNSFKNGETDRKSSFQLFCCIWHNIFGKKVEQSDLFVDLLCFCWMKVWNIFFAFRRWYVNEFLFRKQLRYFNDKISLGFVLFLQFFTIFCIFSLPFFKFCLVIQSNSYYAKAATNVLFEFYRFALPVFLLLSICFFSFTFTLFFPALYNNLCTKATLNVVTLVSHSQETGDENKRALWCYNARSVTNHIADFLLLIL